MLSPHRKHCLALLVVCYAAVVACGGSGASGTSSGMNREQALARVREVVDATRRDVLASLQGDLMPARETACTDRVGRPDGTSNVPYGFRFNVRDADDPSGLIEKIAERWRSQGFDIKRGGVGTPIPSVYAYDGDYEYSAAVDRANPTITMTLGGVTPCLPS